MCSASVGGGQKSGLPQYSTSRNVSPTAFQNLAKSKNPFDRAKSVLIPQLIGSKVPPAPDAGPKFGLRIQPEALGASDLRNPFLPSVKRNG